MSGQFFDSRLHAERYATTPGDEGAQSAIDAVQADLPEGATIDYLTFPVNGRGVYQVGSSEQLGGPESEDYRYLVWYVDPGSARVNGNKDYDESFTAWMYRGHEFLWQDNGVFGVFDPDSGWCRKDAEGLEPGGVSESHRQPPSTGRRRPIGLRSVSRCAIPRRHRPKASR